MESYRPYPPQSSFGPPNQNPFPATNPSAVQQNQYTHIHGGLQHHGASSSYPPPNYGYGYPHPRNQPPQYQFQAVPGHQAFPLTSHHHASSQSSMNCHSQPAAPPVYYQASSQYSLPLHLSTQETLPPPPPPPGPPVNSLVLLPPPPPSIPPPAPPPPPSAPSELPTNTVPHDNKITRNERRSASPKQHKHSAPSVLSKKGPHTFGDPAARGETEEERRLRKKRELEKQRQEEKREKLIKDSRSHAPHKSHGSSAGAKPHGTMAGSRMGDRRPTSILSGERIDNRLKKPTTFVCKLKFRNELPDPTAQPKLLSLSTNRDQYTKYAITSLEKLQKPHLFVEPDLGIPLDLLDLSVYNAPSIRPPLSPEDEALLRDDEQVTPTKQNGIKRKERSSEKAVSWLVKTQYISPLSTESTKLSMTEKQAKELRESRQGRKLFLEDLNSREKQIQAIEESFRASKLRPVHQTNPKLEPVEILPLLPDFDRYEDQYVMVAFDSDPTADSELYNKLDNHLRGVYESQAIMKSFVVTGSDPSKPEKFLAYMVPAFGELTKDICDENEDIYYTWIREYHWDVWADDEACNPTTYFVTFDEDAAHYVPLPTKLILQKKKAKEGRLAEDVEHFPVPSRVTIRRRPYSAVGMAGPGGISSNHVKGNKLNRETAGQDGHERHHKLLRMDERDHFDDDAGISE